MPEDAPGLEILPVRACSILCDTPITNETPGASGSGCWRTVFFSFAFPHRALAGAAKAHAP